MKILFITGLYAKGSESELNHGRGNVACLQNAPNTFQWAVVEGLELNDVHYNVVSFPFLPCFPIHYKKLYTTQESLSFCKKNVGVMERYCTLMVLKEYSIKSRLKSYIAKWLAENQISEDEEFSIMVYTPNVAFLSAVLPFKKQYKNLKLAVIVTDLIDDYKNFTLNNSVLKKIQLEREYKKVHQLYREIDKFILLTKPMEEKIPEAVGKNIVIEGIASEVVDDLSFVKEEKEKIIFYGGTLQPYSGVLDLVNAFSAIEDSSLRLVICGSGHGEDYIKKKSLEDERIIFKGSLPRYEVLQLQRNASLLVNPRKPTSSLTRYSFPSKTMEYLVSGTPMLGYKLEGIPSEYYQYYYTVDDLSENGLKDKILEIFALSPIARRYKAESAYNFIKREKCAQQQVMKIIEFLSK